MKHLQFDQFLESRGCFEQEAKGETRLNKSGRLLFGATIATEIDKVVPTDASYRYNGRTFSASYSIAPALANGIGVLDEWREIPSEPFDVYGFYYDSEFEEFMFNVGLMDVTTEEVLPVKIMPTNPREIRRLANLTIAKAFTDLLTIPVK